MLVVAGAAAASAQAAEPTSEPLLRLETGMHTALIRRIATDREGRWAVTASHDKTARVWDVMSGALVNVLRPPQDVGNEGKLSAVALSPDGQVVALAGSTGWDWNGECAIYLFDRASARLLHRIPGLPNIISHLAFSPDGRWLAATLLGPNGIRVFDVASGDGRGHSGSYDDSSYSVHFSGDSRRLLSGGRDGQLRLHVVDDNGGLQLLQAASLTGGREILAARFSPDGRRVAVGFADSSVVQVLDASTLRELARPATTGVDNGDLSNVAWSADGRSLLAGGQWELRGDSLVRRWVVDDWLRYEDIPLARNTLMDLVPLPTVAGGGWLFAAGDPSWGVLDRFGRVLRRQNSAIADLRNEQRELRLSADSRRVRVGYLLGAEEPQVFDLGARILEAEATAPPDPTLQPARTTAAGLNVTGWRGRVDPKLNGKPLALKPHETCRGLAITPDSRRFVLGTEWHLRLFDATGQPIWTRPVPAVVWAVNASADGRFVVAAYADGTIRWHRLNDGQEILALFPHADRRRWVAWTPEGYFAAAPGAEDLIGYHLNQGQDREGEFVSARQVWETFYQPGLISRRLDADGDRLLAEQVQRRGDVRRVLKEGEIPELALEPPAQAESRGAYELALRVLRAGEGAGKLVLRVDDTPLDGRWTAPALTPGRVVRVPLELSAGQHKVTAELVDGRGVASKPVSVQVNVVGVSRGPGALHLLAVGVTRYRDRALASGVSFAAADAVAVAAALQAGGRGLYARVNPIVLPDEQATRDGIEAAGRKLAAEVRPDDTVVLYMAGHGVTANGDYQFLPWETRYTNFDALVAQALSADRLREMMAAIVARKVLVLLDTCSAGAFSLVKGRQIDDKAALDRFQRMSGRALIAAAADEKMALEGEGRHGVFTFAVLRALEGAADRDSDGLVDVGELAKHVDDEVPAITKRKWGYEQFPTMRTEGSQFTLVRYAR